MFNSLVPGRSECDSKNVIFNLVLLIGIFRSSHDNALSWMPQDLTDDKSTLVQVMAWCRQATSHYLSQCWLSSLSPYGVARQQWVNVPLHFMQRSFRAQYVTLSLTGWAHTQNHPSFCSHPWWSSLWLILKTFGGQFVIIVNSLLPIDVCMPVQRQALSDPILAYC